MESKIIPQALPISTKNHWFSAGAITAMGPSELTRLGSGNH